MGRSGRESSPPSSAPRRRDPAHPAAIDAARRAAAVARFAPARVGAAHRRGHGGPRAAPLSVDALRRRERVGPAILGAQKRLGLARAGADAAGAAGPRVGDACRGADATPGFATVRPQRYRPAPGSGRARVCGRRAEPRARGRASGGERLGHVSTAGEGEAQEAEGEEAHAAGAKHAAGHPHAAGKSTLPRRHSVRFLRKSRAYRRRSASRARRSFASTCARCARTRCASAAPPAPAFFVTTGMSRENVVSLGRSSDVSFP